MGALGARKLLKVFSINLSSRVSLFATSDRGIVVTMLINISNGSGGSWDELFSLKFSKVG